MEEKFKTVSVENDNSFLKRNMKYIALAIAISLILIFIIYNISSAPSTQSTQSTHSTQASTQSTQATPHSTQASTHSTQATPHSTQSDWKYINSEYCNCDLSQFNINELKTKILTELRNINPVFSEENIIIERVETNNDSIEYKYKYTCPNNYTCRFK